MKRYLPSVRTRSSSSTSALQDQFIRELTAQATSVLNQLSQQFTQDLQVQASQILQGSLGGGVSADGDGLPNLAGLGQLFSTGTRMLVSKPVTSQSTVETTDSQNAQSQFKLSQTQALAEANLAIARGNKNL